MAGNKAKLEKTKTKKRYILPFQPRLPEGSQLQVKSQKGTINVNVYSADNYLKAQQVENPNPIKMLESKFKVLDPVSKWLVSRNGRFFLGGLLVLALANGAYKSINERKRTNEV